MAIDIAYWTDLYKKFPEVFQIIKIGGVNILKILPSKFKEYFPKIKEYLKDKNIGSKEQVLHKTEILKYLTLKEINFDEKNKLIKKYMKGEYWSLYLLGRRALIEKNNYNHNEVMKIKNEGRQLAGNKGLRIINFVIQGYFEEIFIPLLKHQIGILKIDSEIYTWFNTFLDSQMDFFPRAIWVMNNDSDTEIKMDLYKRCVTNAFKNINIHTVGEDNCKKIEDTFIELGKDKSFPKFDFKKKEELPKSGLYTYAIVIKN
ncbi:MAG: hypothetical protein PHD81_00750 [Candidatus Nanoarchaeia archaeon]|nr:hypothetical protein [Candidatus Nanoarchaeia archaeon]MDD5587619.1 hypothetical protein [Candidatus Nanoarchaeia archaeon]